MFSANHPIHVMTCLFFGFVGTWAGSGNLRECGSPLLASASRIAACLCSCVEIGRAYGVDTAVCLSAACTVTYSDAAELLRKCCEADLTRLPSRFESFFGTAPQPHGQYISDKATRLLGWVCKDNPTALERSLAAKL